MKYIITERQYKILSESLPVRLRRRLTIENLKDDLDWIVSDEIDASDYKYPGVFIAEVCDFLKNMIIENFENESDVKISNSDKDQIFYYLVDTFENDLIQYHHNYNIKKR